ncbi:hypothetical protein SLA2020_268420 [Shorea laevis]
MDRSFFYKMLLIESDSDEELEVIAKLAIEEESSTLHGNPKRRRTFIMRDRLQAGKIFFATILLNDQYILTNIFVGGFG